MVYIISHLQVYTYTNSSFYFHLEADGRLFKRRKLFYCVLRAGAHHRNGIVPANAA